MLSQFPTQRNFKSFSPPKKMSVVSDGISKFFNVSEATRAVARDTYEAFASVWHTNHYHKINLIIFFIIFGNRRLLAALDGAFLSILMILLS